jgi:hypothetical protein
MGPFAGSTHDVKESSFAFSAAKEKTLAERKSAVTKKQTAIFLHYDLP